MAALPGPPMYALLAFVSALFAVLFVQWVRSSMKEAEREDRRLDLLEARSARSAATPERPGDDR